MEIALTHRQLRRLRAGNQLLASHARLNSPASVVRKLCALQSQEWPSAQIAIAARARGITRYDVQHSRENERSFVLTWSLRGTLHLVAAEDIAAQLSLFGRRAIRGTARRYQRLGLTEHVRERSLDEIADILLDAGSLTRAELAERLAWRDIPVAGQAIHHLVRHAALRGLICLGPERDGALTFVLLKKWLPDFEPVPSNKEQLPALARRYLAAYGPASSADFSRWTGLSARNAQTAFDAIAAETVDVELTDGSAQMLAEQREGMAEGANGIGARFLPRYDNYLLAYQSRDFMAKPAYAKRVHPGGGLIRACVTIDGEAVANWRLEKRAKASRITVSPFEQLSPDQRSMMETEAKTLGKFLATDIELRLERD